jgi:type VI secretion system protein ImpC
MADAKAATAAVQAEEVSSVSLLDQIVHEGRFTQDEATRERGKDLVKAFVQEVIKGAEAAPKDVETAITARIAQIDKLVSAQLNEIIHHKDFQKLEASWRGLRYLLDQSETGEALKIKVLNVSKKDLLKDLRLAAEFDQSGLFKKVYEEEFGVFGGAPFSALVGDYEFGPRPEDIEFLEKIAQVASTAHAPFISAAAPEMLNLENYTQIGSHRDIGKVFDSTSFAKWKSFRQSEDARYVGLALPHVLMRLPYGADTRPIEAFSYEEGVDGSDHSKYLWGNAAYAMGARLTNAFAKFGWCAAIRGVEGGGLVEGLPAHTFRTDEGDVALKCPTEVAITDRREKELADNGFIPLVHCKNTDYAAFFSVQSCNKPKTYDKDAANANAKLSAQLPYIFAMSRFAHYLKAMMRDKIGSFMSRSDCQRFLNQWISNYVCADDNATPTVKAELPLREAQIEVQEIPGKPGAYRAIAFLKPHFQLDELSVSLRLVADLPASARK